MSETSNKIYSELERTKENQRSSRILLLTQAEPLFLKFLNSILLSQRDIVDLQFFDSEKRPTQSRVEQNVNDLTEFLAADWRRMGFCVKHEIYHKNEKKYAIEFLKHNDNTFSVKPDGESAEKINESFIRSIVYEEMCVPKNQTTYSEENTNRTLKILTFIEESYDMAFRGLGGETASQNILYIYNRLRHKIIESNRGSFYKAINKYKLWMKQDNISNYDEFNEFSALLSNLRTYNLLPRDDIAMRQKHAHLRDSAVSNQNRMHELIKELRMGHEHIINKRVSSFEEYKKFDVLFSVYPLCVKASTVPNSVFSCL